jgi:hypothetical protein
MKLDANALAAVPSSAQSRASRAKSCAKSSAVLTSVSRQQYSQATTQSTRDRLAACEQELVVER